MLLRKAPVKQRNVSRPNMWVTGGRRSDTGFHSWHNKSKLYESLGLGVAVQAGNYTPLTRKA